ncbi:MAG TPA: hypothetical protein VHA35_22325 [Dongiaceae bacterium]|nr:hypothetical protein [Dongiaceae bacterium]
MSVVSIMNDTPSRHAQPAGRGEAEVPIRCRLFGQGREDWNRGLRELRRTIVHEGTLARLADGAVRLTGLPSLDLRLGPAEIDRVRRDGLRIVSPIIEIELDAPSFRRALSALPPPAEVRPFPRRA